MAKKAKTSSRAKKPSTGARNGPGRPTQQDLTQRKSTVLDVATSLFLEKGYAEASLVDIARKAGVATRTIYQHFGNKEDVFRAVVDKLAAERDYKLPEINDGQDLFSALMNTAHYVCTVAFENSAIEYQRLMIAESQRFPKLMQQIFDVLFHRFHNNVTETFRILEAQGKIPASNHAENTKFFIDLLLGTAPMQLSMHWIDSGPSEKELRDKVALFIAGRFGLDPKSGAKKSSRTSTGKKATKTR